MVNMKHATLWQTAEMMRKNGYSYRQIAETIGKSHEQVRKVLTGKIDSSKIDIKVGAPRGVIKK